LEGAVERLLADMRRIFGDGHFGARSGNPQSEHGESALPQADIPARLWV